MNKGVILGQRDTDWVAGAIPFEELNPSGDWTAWLPPGEWQYVNNFDLMACVTFSALNCIETVYHFRTGYKLNFSDRFTAYMSGTTTNGNWLWKVGDSIRKDGVVLEAKWPTPQNATWENYYVNPPLDVINEAKTFLNDWTINYEFIDFSKESLLKHLKHSPIQVVIPGHAVMLFASTQQVNKYFDSYEPFIKERTEGFASALKYVMTPKTMQTLVMLDGGKDIWLVRDGKRSLLYNYLAFQLIGGNIDFVQKLTQAQLDAIPDSGKVLAGLDQE